MIRTASVFPLVPGALVCVALVLGGCNARWQSLDSAPLPATAAADLHNFSGAGRAQAHRDFPRGLEEVWQATVQTLHARGVGVPKSVTPEGQRVHLDLDALHLLIEERVEGRVCVLVRFRALEETEGEVQSLKLLDELHDRLR